MRLFKFPRSKILVRSRRKSRCCALLQIDTVMDKHSGVRVICFTKPDLDFLESTLMKHKVLASEDTVFRYSDDLELRNFSIVNPFTEETRYYIIDITVLTRRLRSMPKVMRELRENRFRVFKKVGGKDLYIV